MSSARHINLKIILALGTILAVAVFSGWFLISSLRDAYETDQVVIDIHAKLLVQAEKLRFLAELKISNSRAYLLYGIKSKSLPQIKEARTLFFETLNSMQSEKFPSSDSVKSMRDGLFKKLISAEAEHQLIIDQAIQIYQNREPYSKLHELFLKRGAPARKKFTASIDSLVELESNHLDLVKKDSALMEKRIRLLVNGITSAALIIFSLIAFFIFRLVSQVNKLLEDSLKAISKRDMVLNVVSHDLKNPLSAILLGAEGLTLQFSKNELDSKYIKAITLIRNSANHMTDLIEDLLELAQLESGHMVVNIADTSIETLLNGVNDMFTPLIQEKLIRFEISNEANSSYVRCDSKRITQVLSNLLGNAMKFTLEGGAIFLAVREEADGQIHFSVRDTGSGISSAQIPYLFDRFWQADRHGRFGVGLGLAITKGIAEAHHTDLLVESEEGVGSTFSFLLEKVVGAPAHGFSRLI